GNVAIARGAGDGTFTALSQARAQVGVLAVADFNGDGALDVAIRDSSLTGLRVLPTDGAGHLGAAITVDAAARPVALASGDLDGDGDADLAWIEESAALARATRGAASWSATSSVALSGSNYAAMALYDVDGDHQLDALLGSYTIELVGSLTAAPRAIGTRRAFDLAVADIDQDGRRDVVAGGESALLTLRDTTGDWVAATGLPAISGTAYRIDAADLDEDGALDLVVSLLGSGTRDIVLVHAHP
ncbi:MAG: VCBS repeat-containing protein, partial [Sandaracinaceae bacterium]|nr:VCBS repeat-containing protein [Sandaracinaceae bacterium]